MQPFDYKSAGSVEEVLSLLASGNGSARILCGGTDLLVQLRENRAQAELLIDVKNIPELTALRYDPQEGLWIGGYAVGHNEFVLKKYPGLVDAVQLIGGVQIQFRASLGGNLCNASPAADSIPALIVHKAVCVIAGNKGECEIPVEQFCTAPGKNALQHGEFLLAIKVPVVEEYFGAHYLRFIPRNEMDIAVVGAGASVDRAGGGRTHPVVRGRSGSVFGGKGNFAGKYPGSGTDRAGCGAPYFRFTWHSRLSKTS